MNIYKKPKNQIKKITCICVWREVTIIHPIQSQKPKLVPVIMIEAGDNKNKVETATSLALNNLPNGCYHVFRK